MNDKKKNIKLGLALKKKFKKAQNFSKEKEK